MPKTKYSCNICRQEYDSFEEAERCEHNHEVAKELEKTLDSKFEVGAIVKERHGSLFMISSKFIKFDENNKPYWVYCIGNDYNLKLIYKRESELELVLTNNQVEELIKSFDDKLKQYGFDFTSFCDMYFDLQ
jgi:hypothetical protein